MQLFSCEIYKISKNTFFAEQLQWLLLVSTFQGLSRVFKGVRDENRCDFLQYIPHLAEKGICCLENPEAATIKCSVKEGLQLY